MMKNLIAIFTSAFCALSATALADGAPAGPPTTVSVINNANANSDYNNAVAIINNTPKPAIIKAANNLRAGTVLHRSDLAIEGDGAAALESFVGMEIKRAVYAGKVLSPNDVGLPTAIERNAIVSLEFQRGPLSITTAARALDAGAVGEAVRVMNLSSKTILTAVITGPNKARTQ